MESHKFTPKPTEYRGVSFRSKSEAMFALWLDLSSNQCVRENDKARTQESGKHVSVNEGVKLWSYEPRYWPDYFRYDFRVCWVHTGRRSVQPFLMYDFIEYKPKQPTAVYAENFFKSYELAVSEIEEYGLSEISRRSNAYIYFGSVYTEPNMRGNVSVESPGGPLVIEYCDWIADYADAIRKYRFDLKDGGYASH